MPGIPHHLQQRLLQVLLACSPLDSHQELKAVFLDTRLHSWRDKLPETDNREGRATILADFLFNRYSSYNQNALVTFLRVMGERTPKGDACHQQLITLADDLEVSLDETLNQDPPYKGMAYFQEEDAHLFFGREQLTNEIVEQLLSKRPDETFPNFLAVIGASGSGKSSLIRAGIVPAIRRQKPDWHIHVITPTAHPLKELANSLTRDIESVTQAATLIDDMYEDSRSLDLYIGRKCDNDEKLLLVIDQFEELFTLCKDPLTRQIYVDNLMSAVATPGSVNLLISLRADFYSHCSQYDSLRGRLADFQVYIGPMDENEMRKAIEQPALLHGLILEPEMVNLILDDVGKESGALPLLSHALLETWRRREGQVMKTAGYLASGRVQGAIAQTAEQVYQNLRPEHQTIAHNIFLRLTELGEGTEDTSRKVALQELVINDFTRSDEHHVLGILTRERLVTTSDGFVEVAHEALIRGWPRLQGWLNDNREGLRQHWKLREAALDWDSHGRNYSYLYEGARLSVMEEWLPKAIQPLTELERAFVDASILRREQEIAKEKKIQQSQLDLERKRADEQTRRVQVIRKALIGIVFLLVIAVGTSTYGMLQRNAAVVEANARATEAAVAKSGMLAAHAAQNLSEGNMEMALLLSIEAYQKADTLPARRALLSAISFFPYPVRYIHKNSVDDCHTGLLPDRLGFSPTLISFAKDERAIVFTDLCNEIILWDVTSGQEIMVLDIDDNLISFALSPDGRLLAVGGSNNTITIWHYGPSAMLSHLDSFKHPCSKDNCDNNGVAQIVFNPNGDQMVSASSDGTIALWNIESDMTFGSPTTIVENIRKPRDRFPLAFSPDGNYLAWGTADDVVVWMDLRTNETFPKSPNPIHNQDVLSVAFSPDGEFLASGSSDGGTLILWKTKTGEMVSEPFYPEYQKFMEVTYLNLDGIRNAGFSDSILDIAFSPNGDIVATGSRDGRIVLWDTSNWTEIGQPLYIPEKGAVTSLDFSQDGKTLAAGYALGLVALWEIDYHDYLGNHEVEISSIAFNKDGSILASGDVSGTITLWNVDSHEPLYPPISVITDTIESIAFSGNGRYFSASTHLYNILEFSVEDGVFLGQYIYDDGTPGANTIAYSPDSELLASGHGLVFYSEEESPGWISAGTTKVLLWDVETRSLIADLPQKYLLPVGSVAFSPDGKLLASGSSDLTTTIWDIDSQEPVYEILSDGVESPWNGIPYRNNSIVFSPSGTYLAIDYAYSDTEIWDYQSGEYLASLPHSIGTNLNMAIADNGKFLIATNDTEMLFWDLGPKLLIGTLPLTGIIPTAFAYSPKNQYVAVGDEDGGIILWDTNMQTLIDLACHIVGRNMSREEVAIYLQSNEPHVTCPNAPQHPSFQR